MSHNQSVFATASIGNYAMDFLLPYYYHLDAVEPEPASTVMPVRDRNGALEVYMTQRNDELKFLGGYYVFPGGKVDEQDSEKEAVKRCAGITPAQARDLLMSNLAPGRCLAHWVAGIRELFEEVGILLAYDIKGNIPDFNDRETRRRMDSYRRSIQSGKLAMNDMMEREGLSYAADRLVYFSHWITPPGSPRRYDTRFFIARVPATQKPRHHKGEVQVGLWLKPCEALDKAKKGEWPMIPPTIVSLKALSRRDSVEDLMGAYKK